MKNDSHYMKYAFELAEIAHPAPNPQVGAVLVKNGKIIGEGFHQKPGEPHAEIIAIRNAEQKGFLVDGATLYVTLEPCAHLGKTPPCIDSIIFSGIIRVVIGCIDKNPLVNGKGITILQQAGITVDIFDGAYASLYQSFFHYIKTGLPSVTLKSAMSLDGKIAKQATKQTWITGEHANIVSHHLRKQHDAILVGIGTVLADNPQLTCRVPCKRQPTRVIMDSKLRIPLDARVLSDTNVIIATTKQHGENNKNREKFAALRCRGVRFIVTNGKIVNLKKVLKALPSYGILSLLVEGGSRINTSFLQGKFVNRICFIIAPVLFGRGIDVVVGELGKWLQLSDISYKRVGRDFYVEGVVKNPKYI